MAKTYILLPNMTTPPPPQGPLHLGHIVRNPSDPEVIPLNRKDRIAIPEAEIPPPDIKDGFTSTRGQLRSGSVGVWAQLLGTIGLDASAGVEHTNDEVIHVSWLETVVFDPDIEYVRQAVNSTSVKAFLEASKFALPVFIVTGLKIARGASTGSTAIRASCAKLGLSAPVPGSGVSIGAAIDATKQRYEGTSFEGSTDFILAFRVRRVRCKKGQLEQKIYTKGASMMDGDDDGSKGNVEILGLDEETDLSEIDPYSQLNTVEDGESRWLVPNR
jgi:hypothetical protein